MPHGVDYEHFSKAVSHHLPAPADIADIPHPRLGFFGLIRDWVDLDLLADVARRRPDWHLVLIGDSTIDLSPYQCLANMHFLGRKPYAELPAYCKEFDAGLVPFKINELTKAVNPIKLREYLAAGLPVVSTPLPEVKACGPWVRIAADAEEFVGAVEAELRLGGTFIGQRRDGRRRAIAQSRGDPLRGDARRDLAREGGSDLAGLVRKRVGGRSPSLRRETLETPCGKLLSKRTNAEGHRLSRHIVACQDASEGRLGGSARGISASGSIWAKEMGILNPEFHCYRVSDYEMFRQIMRHVSLSAGEDVFVDYGSGKGRVVIMAAESPFRKVIGVEFSAQLHAIAKENVGGTAETSLQGGRTRARGRQSLAAAKREHGSLLLQSVSRRDSRQGRGDHPKVLGGVARKLTIVYARPIHFESEIAWQDWLRKKVELEWPDYRVAVYADQAFGKRPMPLSKVVFAARAAIIELPGYLFDRLCWWIDPHMRRVSKPRCVRTPRCESSC